MLQFLFSSFQNLSSFHRLSLFIEQAKERFHLHSRYQKQVCQQPHNKKDAAESH
jgi:hypothetical protein